MGLNWNTEHGNVAVTFSSDGKPLCEQCLADGKKPSVVHCPHPDDSPGETIIYLGNTPFFQTVDACGACLVQYGVEIQIGVVRMMAKTWRAGHHTVSRADTELFWGWAEELRLAALAARDGDEHRFSVSIDDIDELLKETDDLRSIGGEMLRASYDRPRGRPRSNGHHPQWNVIRTT